MRNCNEDSEKGYILKVDGKYPKEQLGLSSDMPFSPDKMKINKFEKVVCNLYNKKNYFMHMKALKQVLNHGLILGKNTGNKI